MGNGLNIMTDSSISDAGTHSLQIAASLESNHNRAPSPGTPSIHCHRRPDDDIDVDNAVGNADNHNELPVEYQVHEVDMTNPDMDPLEYAFRRYIPIPRAYFWDTASDANDHNQNLPFGIKLWHRSIYYLGECLRRAEAGGEVVANILGLNDGPFDYVTSGMTEDEMARSRAIVDGRRAQAVEIERRKEGGVV
ncbi:hypothetical protein ACHAW5_009565 [Stephanodiscus triporus]|uniref:Uncharacterized protein n=1 Tax=Stephanodiscus triporus TaxID=2934178 RepID=A0ABD3N424_9STRA